MNHPQERKWWEDYPDRRPSYITECEKGGEADETASSDTETGEDTEEESVAKAATFDPPTDSDHTKPSEGHQAAECPDLVSTKPAVESQPRTSSNRKRSDNSADDNTTKVARC